MTDNIKLDIVNEMLKSLSLPPTQSLEAGSITPDGEDALATLERVKDEVLSLGWNENNYTIELESDDDGRIIIPTSYLRIKPYSNQGFVYQSYKPLYDEEIDKTFLFDYVKQTHTLNPTPDYYEITTDLPYEAMSVELRHYVSSRAARIMQEQSFGSVATDGFLVRQEQEAIGRLNQAQFDKEDLNTFADNPRLRLLTQRKHPYYGYY